MKKLLEVFAIGSIFSERRRKETVSSFEDHFNKTTAIWTQFMGANWSQEALLDIAN
jgi:hypothetical protein